MHCPGAAESYRHADQVKLVDLNKHGLAFISTEALDMGAAVEFELRLDELVVSSIKGTLQSAIPAGTGTRYGVVFDGSHEPATDEILYDIEHRLGRPHEDRKSNARRRIKGH